MRNARASPNKRLAANPLQGKTPKQFDEQLTSPGFKRLGRDPMSGKGSHLHPETERKYYVFKGVLDKKGIELPHLGVLRMIYGKCIG